MRLSAAAPDGLVPLAEIGSTCSTGEVRITVSVTGPKIERGPGAFRDPVRDAPLFRAVTSPRRVVRPGSHQVSPGLAAHSIPSSANLANVGQPVSGSHPSIWW